MKKTSQLTRLMAYAGKYRYFTYASQILSALSALIALVPFYYIWRIIRAILEQQVSFQEQLPHEGWMAVGFAVLSLLLYIAGLMCSHLAAFRVATNLRKAALRHVVRLPQGEVERFGSGRLRKMIDESSAATETYLAHQLPDRAGAIATPCGLFVLLFVFDWRLGLFSLIPVVLAFVIMASMTGEEMRKKMTEYQNALEEMSNGAVEYVRGIPVVKTFGQTIYSFQKWEDSIERYGVWVIAYTKQMRLPMLFYTTAINSVFAFLIAAGLWFTREQVTDTFLLNLVFYIIVTPVISLTLTKMMFQSENEMIVEDALKRMDSIFALKPLEEPQHPQMPQDASVVLEGVHFSYPDGTVALKDISMTIRPGETVALVGPSGSGKTTLADLLVRFFDPQQGRVLLGGVDLRQISKKQLMETVGFVFQDSKLLKTSILENVRMGKPEATRQQVMTALQAAQCMDIVEKLPQGIDTVVGTKGVFLSGGEQQRIAMARVLLKDAPILILDEATAFADPDNETKVQAAFTALARNKTVIMIAHRLSTVVQADHIYVLKAGEIAEQGTYKELMQKQGLFSQMWQMYQTSVSWKVEKEG